MQYLYKGMAIPGWGDISGSVLLGWHEKVSIHLSMSGSWKDMKRDANYYLLFLQLTEVAGVGCIVRAMTDRRIV
jgi:actin related protein 2/3 complex subunit 5